MVESEVYQKLLEELMHHDEVSQKYDEIYNPERTYNRLRIKEWTNEIIKTISNPESKTKILEVGGGTGQGTHLLLQKLKVKKYLFRLIETDISKGMLKIAKNKMKQSNISYSQCSVHSLPFKNDTFDIILCRSVLHHVPYLITEVIEEVDRVLKPRGMFFVDEPLDNKFWQIIRNIGEKLGHVSKGMTKNEIHGFSREELFSELTKNFKISKILYFYFTGYVLTNTINNELLDRLSYNIDILIGKIPYFCLFSPRVILVLRKW